MHYLPMVRKGSKFDSSSLHNDSLSDANRELSRGTSCGVDLLFLSVC